MPFWVPARCADRPIRGFVKDGNQGTGCKSEQEQENAMPTQAARVVGK